MYHDSKGKRCGGRGNGLTEERKAEGLGNKPSDQRPNNARLVLLFSRSVSAFLFPPISWLNFHRSSYNLFRLALELLCPDCSSNHFSTSTASVEPTACESIIGLTIRTIRGWKCSVLFDFFNCAYLYIQFPATIPFRPIYPQPLTAAITARPPTGAIVPSC